MRLGLVWATLLLVGAARAAGASPQAAGIDRTLASLGSDIVVLGNSKVSTDLDLPALTRAVADVPGAPAGGWKVANANVFGTSAAVWKAVLESRVYAAGLSPRVVVVFGTLDALLTADLPNETQRAVLAAQMDTPDDHLVQAVFRGVFDDTVRERLRRLLLPACASDRLRERDEGPGRPAYPIVAAAPVAPEASFLPDIVRLAQTHGARVVVIRAPFAPSARWKEAGALGRLPATAQLVHELGADWVDLAADHPPEGLFGDGVHMGAAGRAWTTPRVAERVRDALTGGPPALDVRGPPLVAVVTREGSATLGTSATEPVDAWVRAPVPGAVAPGRGACAGPAALADAALRAAGLGGVSPLLVGAAGACGVSTAVPVVDARGQAGWWATPDAPLRVELPAGLGPMVAEVTGWLVPVGAATPKAWTGPGTDVGLTRIGEGPATGDPAAPVRVFGRLTASGAAPVLRVGGAWLLLDRVDVVGAGLAPDRVGGAPPRRQVFVANGPDPALQLDLLADRPVAGPPPSLPSPVPTPVVTPAIGADPATSAATFARYDVTPWSLPTEEAVATATGRGGCSPLRLHLPTGAPDVVTIVANAGVLVSRPDCGDVAPALAGARWELDPDRGCKEPAHAAWVYPGDRLTWRTPVRAPLTTADGLRLDLGGGSWRPSSKDAPPVTSPAASLHVKVEAEDAHGRRRPVAEGTFAPSALNAGVLSLDLPASPALIGARTLVVCAALDGALGPTADWVLLTSVQVTGHARAGEPL